MAGGGYGAGYHAAEAVAQFRVFYEQGLHHRHVVLKRFVGVGDVGDAIFHDQVEIIAYEGGEEIDKLVGSAETVVELLAWF